MELDNDEFEQQLRVTDQIILDLEQKLEYSIEEVALMQDELYELRVHTDEQIERLTQTVRENGTEL
jgi:hypothetical protein